MDTGNHWKPNDCIRLVALIGAFVLFGIGAWMLYQGISAEGVVDLKSSFLSGTISSSSAGLFMCFFALFIIVFVLTTLRSSSNSPQPRTRRLMAMFWGLLVAVGFCAVGAAVVTDPGGRLGFITAVSVLSMSLVAVVVSLASAQDA
jgi:quinol-cytochrome oxidoreductase complex cytochrome b subunit